MPSKTFEAVVITERDKKIFQFLFENKVATALQITNSFFENNSPKTAYRRLLYLARAGWLRKEGKFLSDRLIHIYGIADKTYEKYVHNEEVNGRKEQLKSNSIEHDLALVDIRLAFKKNQAVQKVYSENNLQSCYGFSKSDEFRDIVSLQSDGAVELLIHGKYRFIVPIEYEASFKDRKRCYNVTVQGRSIV